MQMCVVELQERPGKPLFHLEHYIEGKYIKYNSNSGFVRDDNVRLTPQVGPLRRRFPVGVGSPPPEDPVGFSRPPSFVFSSKCTAPSHLMGQARVSQALGAVAGQGPHSPQPGLPVPLCLPIAPTGLQPLHV